MDYQRHLDKLNESVNEFKILCANNNTQINFLKQENQRLVGLINSLRDELHSAYNTSGQQLSSAISNQVNSTQSAVSNNFINNFNDNNNKLSITEQQLHISNTNNYKNNQKTHTLNTHNSKINTLTIYNIKNNSNNNFYDNNTVNSKS